MKMIRDINYSYYNIKYITFCILLILLFSCNYNDSIVDPNNNNILIPLFSMKGLGKIDTSAIHVQEDLDNPLFCLFWSKDSISPEAVVGMTTRIEVSFPLKLNINIFDLPTSRHLYNPYLYEDSSSLSGKYFEFGIAILVVINDTDNNGKIDPILFDSLEIAFNHSHHRDWIAGIAENHLIIFLSNSYALEWVKKRNQQKIEEYDFWAQWLDLEVGYNLVEPLRVPLNAIENAADWYDRGYNFDGFRRIDHTNEFIEIKLVDDPNKLDISNWGKYFPEWWIWRSKDIRFETNE